MKGRKPKPAEVKKAQGNPGRRPIPEMPEEDAPVLNGAVPTPLTEAAQKVWDMLRPELERMKFLRESDKFEFARYCDMTAKYWQASRDVDMNGTTMLTESEHVTMMRRNPNLDIMVKLAVRLEAMGDRLGLSTLARHRIMQAMMTQPPAPVQLPGPLGEAAARAVDDRDRNPVGFLQ